MSAPHQKQLEREFGAELRTFSTVQKALTWYIEVLPGPSQKTSPTYDPKDRAGPRTPESRATRDLTHAAITAALQGLQHAQLLVEWCNAWRSQEDMAQDEGFPSTKSLRATMRFTENMLEVRLRERGVLE